VPSIIFLVLLVSIFFLSSLVKTSLFQLSYSFGGKGLAIFMLSFLLYPGVVIHELSHLIAAVILFVRVKSMTLVPKVIDGKLRGGSVVIEKVDIFRRTLVGIAPLFGGLIILFLISTYLLPELKTINPNTFLFLPIPLQYALSIYLLFAVSSSMYSSRQDLESLVYTIPVGIVGVFLLYILGFQTQWFLPIFDSLEGLWMDLNRVLVLTLTIQTVVYLSLQIYSTMTYPTRSG